jgi:hypothetical protein
MVVVLVGSTVEKKEGGLKELFSPPHVGNKLGAWQFPVLALAQKLCDPHSPTTQKAIIIPPNFYSKTKSFRQSQRQNRT